MEENQTSELSSPELENLRKVLQNKANERCECGHSEESHGKICCVDCVLGRHLEFDYSRPLCVENFKLFESDCRKFTLKEK